MALASMTSGSTWPKSSPSRGRFHTKVAAMHTRENRKARVYSCPAARLLFAPSLLPMYWLTITAPPEARAVNRKMKKVFSMFTRDTPETAASPA